MLDSQLPYEIDFVDDGGYPTYQFTTISGVKYIAYFMCFSNASDDLIDTYSFSISPIGDTHRVPLDTRISHTLIRILKLFFETRHNSAIYICDDRDDRAVLRFRVFNYWYDCVNDGGIRKIDNVVKLGVNSIFSSLLIRNDNPRIDQITKAYDELFD